MKNWKLYIKKLFLPIVLLLSFSSLEAASTTWVKNAASDSATTNPSPYTNNSNATETLSISGATQLTVTISGTLENPSRRGYCYDYITITDSANNVSTQYCGNINDSFTVTGPSVNIVFHSDGSVVSSGATVSIAEEGTSPTTTWVKNAAGDSATTDPSPYMDNSDATETLTIAGAAELTVTVTGSVENANNCIYDYVTITDSAGTVSDRYCGNINDIFTAVGPSVDLVFHSDGSVTNSGATVSIAEIGAIAHPDNYTTSLNIPLVVSAADGILANDTGSGITITAMELGSLDGTLDPYDTATGSFTFTPDSGFEGTTTFTYTITDNSGHTSTALVTITVVNEPDYTTTLGFELINPQSTRNVIGNYLQAGNTVLCLTQKTSGYPDNTYICQDTTSINNSSTASTSNNYVAKYIKIEDNASLWNASSSFITLPDTYEQNGGEGILWAGLVWQGRFAWRGSNTSDIHYYTENSSGGIDEHETHDASAVTVSDAQVHNIRLKVDNGNYARITANKVYSSSSSYGMTYTSISDVTRLLQDANLNKGKHVFTVANLPTSEGREYSPGIFGGWSLVVIYADNILNGKPRNISIFGGMLEISGSNEDFTISGFKLPSSGDVTAQLSIYSGEGEDDYTGDGVKIQNANNVWINIPTSTSNNVFDAKLTDIDRDHINGMYNDLQENNCGIDVDLFDITDIMTAFDRSTTSLVMNMYAREYIVPAMIAFSTELYQPKLCYDYTYDIGGYVLESENNEVSTAYHRFIPTLTTHVSIRSLEADFALQNVTFTAVSDPDYMWYQTGSTAVAPNLIFGYTDTQSYDEEPLDPVTYPDIITSFTMDLGAGIVPGSGGTINESETTYLRFKHDMNTSQPVINSSLDMHVSFKVDYGSGLVPQAQILDADAICDGGTAGAYEPVYGDFNIVGGNDCDDYNLVTQVSGRPYSIMACGYEQGGGAQRYVTPKTFNTAIEVEIFNVNYYVNQPTLSCHEPDANVTNPFFVDFGGSSSVAVASQVFNVAQRNAGYRVWYLKKADGSIAEHQITSRSDTAEISAVYNDNSSDFSLCSSECPGGDVCYTCLRKYYGTPICSRDNFSIRPEGFSIQFNDETTEITQNTTTTAQSISSGYDYNITVKATAYGTDNPAGRYVKGFASGSPSSVDPVTPGNYNGATMVNDFSTNTNCTDLTSEDFEFTFWEGSADNDEVKLKNVGAYSFHMLDSTWTTVDQDGSNLGCIVGDSTVPTTGMVGCNTSSVYNNATTGQHYDISLLSVPYKFDMTDITYTTQATSNNYVYSNTLGVPPGTNIDNNMSIVFAGNIEAQGADNNPTSNFTTGCYATDVRLSYTSASVPASPTRIDGSALNLRWYEKVASDDTTTTPVGTSDLVSNVSGPKLLAANFAKINQGRSQVDLRINFDRQSNVPHNPFKLMSTALDADCDVLANCTANVEGINNYTPNATQNSREQFDKNTTVLYSRVNAPRKMVMCGDASASCAGTVDYYFEFYANQAAELDANTRALITAILPDASRKRSLDSVNWYRNTQHTAVEGDVTNPSTSTALTESGSSFNNGVQSISFNYSGTQGYPFKDTLSIQANTNVQPWLIYDPYVPAATVLNSPIEFYGPGSWSSQSGQKTSTTTQKKTNRRIRW